MHMADALLSPAVGATLWAATAGTLVCCSRRVQREMDDTRIPLMGVLGAFVFAAQMINFSIPGTGSSGHLGGGLLLAVLLGPCAAFLVIASVLLVQALLFADGGLLALGCNIFNLGFFPCFLAYPLIFRPLAGARPPPGRIGAAALIAAVAALQLGALAVVVETFLSGISALPFASFLLLMQPIHLAIGIVEGVATALVISFIGQARPELLAVRPASRPARRRLLAALAAAAVLTGGGLSWFASTHPDGLEWAIAQVAGTAELPAPAGIHGALAEVQAKTALLPDYQFRDGAPPEKEANWPAAEAGTGAAGLLGGAITLVLTVGIALLLRRCARKAPPA